MVQGEIVARFRNYANSRGLQVSESQMTVLLRGARWLAGASGASGLSQYATAEMALLRAMGPALAYFGTTAEVLAGKLVDLGCGNGAIGATIAFFAPNLSVDLVDRAQRAYTISELLIAKLGLENAQARQASASELDGGYDVAVFRALAPAHDALPLASSVTKAGGRICAYHRRADEGFLRPLDGLEPLETHRTLVDDLVMTCYRT